MNKKVFMFFICLFMIFSFSSCGSLFGFGDDEEDYDYDSVYEDEEDSNSKMNAATDFLGNILGDVSEDFVGGIVKDSVGDVAGDFLGGLAGDMAGGVAGDMIKSAKDISEASEALSPETEYYIGRVAAASILKNYRLYRNRTVTEYVNKICNALTINSEKPYLYKGYFVAILDTDDINAISTPGGHIFISRGLLECANSEDALAGVIAHEISHIQLGHSSEAIRNDRTFDAVKKVIGDSLDRTVKIVPSEAIKSMNELGGELVTKVMNSGFSQIQEFDADSNAIKLMKGAGYNPFALLDMLNAINKRTDSGEGWFHTHPKPRDRINNLNVQLKLFKYVKTDMAAREKRFKRIKDLM